MAKILNCLKYGFWGFISANLFVLILSRSIWLEMRFNLALMVPLGTLVGIGIGFALKQIKGTKWLFITELMTLGVMGFIYGKDWGAWLVIPATIVRDGFYLKMFSLNEVNLILLLILITGNAGWFIQNDKVI